MFLIWSYRKWNHWIAEKHVTFQRLSAGFYSRPATSLTFGGILLYIYALVPIILVETTLAAVIVLFILSYFVSKGNIVSINIATILGVIAPIMSYSTPAHVGSP